MISVLITYFEEKGLLTECLASLFASGTPAEVLVYDDASRFPAAEYIRPEWKVKIFRSEKNRGPGYGRNFLATKASQLYLHFQDSDDLFAPGWLPAIERAAKQGPELILNEVASFFENAPDKLYFDAMRFEGSTDLLEYCIAQTLLCTSITIQKELFHKVGGFDEKMASAEDVDFALRLALEEPKTIRIPEFLSRIRLRKTSRSSNKVNEFRRGAQRVAAIAPRLTEPYLKIAIAKIVYLALKLEDLGSRESSDQVVALARALGPLRYELTQNIFQRLAPFFGFEVTRGLIRVSRMFLPPQFKEWLRSMTKKPSAVRLLGKWESRLLRGIYFGPNFPFKLRLWDRYWNLRGRPRFVLSYANNAWIGLDPTDLVQRSVFDHAAYEPEVWGTLKAFLREHDNVWDIGAHVGTFGIRAAAEGRASVHCFEPFSQTFRNLDANRALNPHLSIATHQIALGQRVEDRTLHVGELGNLGRTRFGEGIASSGSERVECVTVDYLVYERGLLPPTLMKIDVEGEELNVLKGATKLFGTNPPKAIVFEAAVSKKLSPLDPEISKLLSRFGYEIRHIARPVGEVHEFENFLAYLPEAAKNKKAG